MCVRSGFEVAAVALVLRTNGGVQLIGSRSVYGFDVELQYSPERFAFGDPGWCSCAEEDAMVAVRSGRPPRARIAVECLDVVRMLVQEMRPLPQLPSGLYLPDSAYAGPAYAALPAPVR